MDKSNILEKVLGTAKCAADYKMSNMLYGDVFRSTVPHAKIKYLNLEKAKRIPGVACVLDSTSIPGMNRFGILTKDEPCLTDDKIRCLGDAIALVAAETKEILAKALAAIEIEYEEIEPVYTLKRAMEADSPLIHEKTNIYATDILEKGNVEEAFLQCDVIVENVYNIDKISPVFSEPYSCLAYMDDDNFLNIITSTKKPHYVKEEIQRLLGISEDSIRIQQPAIIREIEEMAGINIQLYCSLLAYYAKRPVQMMNYKKNIFSAVQSPLMVIKAKTGADKNGKIIAAEISQYKDIGAYASFIPCNDKKIHTSASNLCLLPNLKVHTTFVYTNNMRKDAYHEYDVPQISLIHEKQMNAIAQELGIGNIAIRIMNKQMNMNHKNSHFTERG